MARPDATRAGSRAAEPSGESPAARATRLRAWLGGVSEVGSRSRWLRPKGNLTRAELGLLLSLALLPLIAMAVRLSAAPGVLGPSLSGTLLPSIGHDLNEMLSLHRVPANDRGQVLYLLFLPTGAMLIALARLTFGLRVIGFRSILIAVGFQQSGVVPSLLLIGVVVAIVIAVRPALLRFRLPYYARVSVVMSLAVVVLLLALMVAPWMRSEVLFGLGFFPVIVLGLLAEGIAKTLDRDTWLAASWRTGMTIGIAMVLAGIGQIPALRELAIRFPELVVTQIVAVVLISEFLDHRLFQDLDARLSGVAVPRLFSDRRSLRVAVVWNRRRNGVIGRLGEPTPQLYDRYAIRRVVAALREHGHTVKLFEGDIRLLSRLRDFVPPHPRTEEPGGIVLNLSQGIQGQLPAAHVPAMLEMSGVAYTGAAPPGSLVAHDKLLTAAALRGAGLEAPDCQAVRDVAELREEPGYPVVVEPRYRRRGKLRVAGDRHQLDEAIRLVVRRHDQEAIVRPPVSGPEIQVAIVGNDPPECLPLVDAGARDRAPRSPARLDRRQAERIRDTALAAFRACGCRDYALVRIRVPSAGRLRVVEVGELGALAPGGAFELAAGAAGMSFAELIERIVDVARTRYRAGAAPSLQLVSSGAEAEPGERAALGA
ncbi:MAG: 7TM domain-containing protein [Myxococcota bacterium]|nr:7TM domain-containing protein [Myxococcota bacterium]